jgi:hypothetical protein
VGLACNINAKGRLWRGAIGLAALLMGAVWLWAGRPSVAVARVGGFVLIAFGAFSIFEGAKGWCAVRAMGFRTRF